MITKKWKELSHRKVDANHIFETDKLDHQRIYLKYNEHISRLESLESGTIVIWEKSYELLDSQTLSVKFARAYNCY